MPGADGEAERFERAVIGSMLQAPSAVKTALSMLVAGDFYRPAHGVIFAAMIDMFARGQLGDNLTVLAELGRRGELMRVGGANYLHDCMRSTPIPSAIAFYATQVLEFSRRRRLAQAGLAIEDMAANGTLSMDEATDRAHQLLREVGLKQAAPSSERFGDFLDEEMDWATAEERRSVRGAATGIGQLDDALGGGLLPGRLIVVAGRPGIGKSVLISQVGMLNGRRGVDTAIFSLEMTRREMTVRILSNRSGVDGARILTGNLTEVERLMLRRYQDELRQYPIHLDVSSSSISQIRMETEKLKQDTDLRVVAVDYMQIVRPSRRTDNRASEVGEIAESLKEMGKTLEVAVLAAAQLNRGPEQRTDRMPSLSDLRESGAIEQAADQVLLLHRPSHYDPHKRPGEMDIILAKNRHGPNDTITAAAQMQFSRLTDPATYR